MNKKVGVTGGIGSGKSYVCRILERMGFPVYYSDKEAKRLTAENPTIREGLIQLLGDGVFVDNQLNKELLAESVFYDETVRLRVNQLIHPQVRIDFEQWAMDRTEQIVFNESALLIETEAHRSFDFIVLVVADKQWRIEKIMARDRIEQHKVIARMEKQLDDEQKMPYADFIIHNDGQPLLIQIEKMLALINQK